MLWQKYDLFKKTGYTLGAHCNTTPIPIVLYSLINFPTECSMYHQTFLQNQTPTPIVFHLLLNFPTKINPTAIPDWGGIEGILDIPESNQTIVKLICV